MQAEYLASLGDSLASKSELLTNGGSWVEFFTGALDQGTKRKDLAWFNKDGLEMTSHTWQDDSSRHLAFLIDASHKQGLFVILNSAPEELEVTLPNQTWGDSFRTVFDSAKQIAELEPQLCKPSDKTKVAPFSVQIWFVNRTTT